MKYFLAHFDKNSGAEWILDSPQASPDGSKASVSILKNGKIPDVTFTMGYELILNATARRVFDAICSHDIEMLPIEKGGALGDFFWMRLMRECDCIDPKASGAVFWEKGEIVPSKVGHLKSLAHMRIDMAKIPIGVQAFRTKGWGPGILFSAALKAQCEANNITGLFFDSI